MKKSIVFILFLAFAISVQAKNYRILSAKINVVVQKNGIIHFEETRTYAFDGHYSWVSFEMPRKGYDEFSNVSVWEGNQSFGFDNDSKENGYFNLQKKDKKYLVKWFIDAQDEHRTFTISYDLKGALIADKEWTEFYWIFLSSHWDRTNESVQINLSFEDDTAVRYWIYDSTIANGLIHTTKRGWQYEAVPNRKNQEVKIQTLFSTSYLNEIPAYTAKISPERAEMEYQEMLQSEIENQILLQKLENIANRLYLIFLLLPIALFLYFYKRNKPIYDKGESDFDFSKSKVHPVLIIYLMNARMITNYAIITCLMKLVHDGFVQLEIEGQEKKLLQDRTLVRVSVTDKPESELKYEFEKDLYRFIKDKTEEYPYLDELFKEDPTQTSKWYHDWNVKVKKEAQKQDWYIEESKTDMYWNIALQSILVVISIGFMIVLGGKGVPIFILSIFGLGFSGFIYHFNNQGQVLYKKMRDAKMKFKERRKNKITVSEKENWSLFIWAIALGISRKDMKWLLRPWQVTSFPHLLVAPTAVSTIDLINFDNFLYGLIYLGGGVVGTGSSSGVSAGSAGGGAGGGAG